jgi:enamine deaminase RidA (YjgF/YER057c/UK114 family)
MMLSGVTTKSMTMTSRLLSRAGVTLTTAVGRRRQQQLQQQIQTTIPSRRCIHVESRIKELGITLPKAAGPRANYDLISYDEESRVMYVSGHLPFTVEDGTLMTGKITGDEGADIDYGYKAARCAALNIISTLSDRLGKLGHDLDQIEKISKLFGIVQSHTDFKHQHLIMDGASDVIMEIFGDKVGYHARSAIGTNTLPLDVTVEIECIIKLKPLLRFSIGQKVECKVGPSDEDWEVGTITQLNYKEPEWENSAPYQIKLLNRMIFAPEDANHIIREVSSGVQK